MSALDELLKDPRIKNKPQGNALDNLAASASMKKKIADSQPKSGPFTAIS